MATLSFEGETHGEIVEQVRRWLASLNQADDLSVADAIEQGAELTKDALRVIAAAAPGPVAHSELVKALTTMGYKATDATKKALVDGLTTVEEITGGGVVQRVQEARKSSGYQMSSSVARSLLKSLRG